MTDYPLSRCHRWKLSVNLGRNSAEASELLPRTTLAHVSSYGSPATSRRHVHHAIWDPVTFPRLLHQGTKLILYSLDPVLMVLDEPHRGHIEVARI